MRKFLTIMTMLSFMAAFPHCKKSDKEISKIIVQGVIGNVTIQSMGSEKKPLPGDELKNGDTIITSSGSLADLQYGSKGVIRINENSKVKASMLLAAGGDNTTELNMTTGKIFVIMSKLKKTEKFMVSTPTAVASVRGTSFRIITNERICSIEALSGKIRVNPMKNGKIIEKSEKIIEENVRVLMDEDIVDKIAEGEQEIKAVALKPEEIKQIKEEVKDIKIQETMNEDIKKEIKEVVLENNAVDERETKKEDGQQLKKSDEQKRRAIENRRKIERDRQLREKAEKDRLEQERLVKEKAEKERLEKEKQAKIEKAKKEQQKKENRVKNIPNL